MELYVFKILKTPIANLSVVMQQELDRKIADSGNNKELTSIIDFNLSDIKFVGMSTLTVDKYEVYDNEEVSIMTFADFIDWVNKYDDGTMYMGWNCGWYDIPHIKYEVVKKDLTITRNSNLFNIKKYQDYPVYDLKEKLFSYGYSSSILLTLEGLDIPYTYYDYNELFIANDDDLYANYLTDYIKNIKNIFIKSKGILL